MVFPDRLIQQNPNIRRTIRELEPAEMHSRYSWIQKIFLLLFHRLKIKNIYAYLFCIPKYFKRYVSNNPQNQSNLAVVVIVRDEEKYLEHWMKYHSFVGVDHFYIYINEKSPKAISKYLSALRDCSRIAFTLIEWNEKLLPTRKGNSLNKSRLLPSIQELMFFHWRLKFSRNYTHMLRIDVDEYVYRSDWQKGDPSIVPLLPNSGCLEIRGYNFGSSGWEHYTAEPPTSKFTMREITKTHSKSISHLSTSKEIFNAHVTKPVKGAKLLLSKELVVNHYRIKSREEFLIKKVRTNGYTANDYSINDFEAIDEISREVDDCSLKDLLDEINID